MSDELFRGIGLGIKKYARGRIVAGIAEVCWVGIVVAVFWCIGGLWYGTLEAE